MWILLLICFIPKVKSTVCNPSEIVEGRFGKEVVLKFLYSDLIDQYNKQSIGNKLTVQDLKRELKIGFKKINSTEEETVFKNGKLLNGLASRKLDTYINYGNLMVKIRKLEKEDVGIYKIYYRTIYLRQKVLIITGKPTINERSPPNPVLLTEDNPTRTIQLACPSVSTSIGDCQLASTMYIMWYQNGMRMTELDPTLSQINVNVDQNAVNIICLATNYEPCYQRLRTTKHYIDASNVEECDGVFNRETFFVKTQFESEDCNKSEIIDGRVGEVLVFKFLYSDLLDQYNKKIIGNKITVQDLKRELKIGFTKINSTEEVIVFKDGKSMNQWASDHTDTFIDYNTLMVKIRKLEKEDVGIYKIYYRTIYLAQKALIIPSKPIIKGKYQPNPVLKPEDNLTATIQLECPSVSTSTGDCQLASSMYIIWYENGLRMIELDPTLSQINVTVDLNGGNFMCLVMDYIACYYRLQTTNYYNEVMNIKECNRVTEKETYFIKPEYGPIDVKLEPHQRKITVNKNENLEVSCSAKCRPKCDLKWTKDLRDLDSNGLVVSSEYIIRNDLKLENISSSSEGVYVCLVNNTHGETERNFTLIVTGTEKKVLLLIPENDNILIIIVPVIVVIIAVIAVTIVIWYKKCRSIDDERGDLVPAESREDETREDTSVIEVCSESGDITSRNDPQSQYAELVFSNGERMRGRDPGHDALQD